MNFKGILPWQAKIILKLLISRMPFTYRLWQKLNLFKHGDMDQPSYAFRVFHEHFERSQFARKSGNFVVLELGPGDSLFSAMIARGCGAAACYLLDTRRFARYDVESYVAMYHFLRNRGLVSFDIAELETEKRFLKITGSQYLTFGLQSLRSIPDRSVDYIWSNAVLEHVRRNEFLKTMRELRRILRPDGVCSHQVDLRDHLSEGLNNLRFSSRVWESAFMVNSGFYTNRIRMSEMLDMFHSAGFDFEVVRTQRWETVPIHRANLSKDFQHLPENELNVFCFDVLLRPRV